VLLDPVQAGTCVRNNRKQGEGKLCRHPVADDEALVEVPPTLMGHLAKDGWSGTVSNMVPPIIEVTRNGNYIVRGKRITDEETLSQMRIPDYETCVHVTRSAIAALLGA
jgi:hypothetical protein